MATNSTIKALRALGKSKIIPLKEMGKHLRELTGKNDRLVAIVCASLVETGMEALLKDYMPHGKTTDLFDPNRALSTFSAKIELCWSLGLIDADIKRNANIMREIRNIFAHKVGPINFKTKEVVAACRLLTLHKRHRNLEEVNKVMRRRYMFAAIGMGAEMAVRRVEAGWIRPTPVSLP